MQTDNACVPVFWYSYLFLPFYNILYNGCHFQEVTGQGQPPELCIINNSGTEMQKRNDNTFRCAVNYMNENKNWFQDECVIYRYVNNVDYFEIFQYKVSKIQLFSLCEFSIAVLKYITNGDEDKTSIKCRNKGASTRSEEWRFEFSILQER